MADSGSVADKRFRIVLAQIREGARLPNSRVEWQNTHKMLADGLTKDVVSGDIRHGSEAIRCAMKSSAYKPQAGRLGRVANLALQRAALIVSMLRGTAAQNEVVVYEAQQCAQSARPACWAVAVVHLAFLLFVLAAGLLFGHGGGQNASGTRQCKPM